jgi:uncharacterized peroxidase-related enzyme
MSRLNTVAVNQATGATAELFSTITKAIGKVPNAYATIGTNSPSILAHVLQTGALLKQASLSLREQEAINLAVSESTGCDYCVAAHSMTGKMAGFTAGQLKQLRTGSYPEDAKIDALIRFAVQVVTTTGTVPTAAVEAVKVAGYDDRQIVEALLTVNAILFTNMLNRVNDTTLDFPKVA